MHNRYTAHHIIPTKIPQTKYRYFLTYSNEFFFIDGKEIGKINREKLHTLRATVLTLQKSINYKSIGKTLAYAIKTNQYGNGDQFLYYRHTHARETIRPTFRGKLCCPIEKKNPLKYVFEKGIHHKRENAFALRKAAWVEEDKTTKMYNMISEMCNNFL